MNIAVVVALVTGTAAWLFLAYAWLLILFFGV